MLKNPVLVRNTKAAIDAGKAVHLMGLVGEGGVHSHSDHWFGVMEMATAMVTTPIPPTWMRNRIISCPKAEQ